MYSVGNYIMFSLLLNTRASFVNQCVVRATTHMCKLICVMESKV